jgi:hypothetical protein
MGPAGLGVERSETLSARSVRSTCDLRDSDGCGEEWARQDSNLRPTDYESAALTN